MSSIKEAPPYTVVERRMEGADVITAVVIGNEVLEFVIDRFEKRDMEQRLGATNE